MTDFKEMIDKANRFDAFAKEIQEWENYNEEVQQIAKDRLDFGFDSIYFRFAAVVDELGELKEKESHRNGEHFNRKVWANGEKNRFYRVLEQLTHAHEEVDKNGIN